MNVKLLAAAGALGLTALGAPAFAAAADAENATVTVVHGVPGATVDVYADGEAVLTGFTFKDVSDPLSLPAGTYDLEVRAAGDAASKAPLFEATESIPAGADVTVVAALNGDGDPGLVPFVNDTSAANSGEGRLVVRHTAAAPAVDVYAGDAKVISSLEPGKQEALDVAAGTIDASVTVAGESDPVLGPVDVDVMGGMATVVYAVGSAADGTLDVIPTQYALGGTPTGAQAGTGGMVADASSSVLPIVAAGTAGLLLIAFGGRALLARD